MAGTAAADVLLALPQLERVRAGHGVLGTCCERRLSITRNDRDSADPSAAVITIIATSQYTRLRSAMSGSRPNTSAPRKAAATMVLLSMASPAESRCHSAKIRHGDSARTGTEVEGQHP
jgi:hypothetical protein